MREQLQANQTVVSIAIALIAVLIIYIGSSIVVWAMMAYDKTEGLTKRLVNVILSALLLSAILSWFIHGYTQM